MKSIFSLGRSGALLALAVTGASMMMPGLASAAPTARLVASRTSGPAPLAVYFDATGTTDSAVDPFRQLGYRFTFDDSNAGTWTHSGLSKNQQVGGPMAAHVFEQPGTYTVEVTAKDASGASSVASVTITVQSADSTYPGTRTVCLSRSSDFAGCPSGAQQIANAGSWPSFQSGNRYLLHRGQDFTGLGGLTFGLGITDAQLGTFGSGNKPLIGSLTIPSGENPSTQWSYRVAVYDIDASNIVQFRGGTDLLLFRNTVNRGGMIDIASAFGYAVEHSTNSGWRFPENIFVVENNIDRNYFNNGDNPNGIAGNAYKFALLGNTVDRTWEHNMRLWQAHKAIIAHNNLTGRCGEAIRHPFKLHAFGMEAALQPLVPGGSTRQRTSQVQIADNRFGSSASNVNWLATSGPQNNESAEGIEQLIWEDNRFWFGSNYARDLTWAGRNITERGNWNQTSNRAATSGVAGERSLPGDWNGPYYTGQPSMKSRFTGTEVRPQPPALLSVE